MALDICFMVLCLAIIHEISSQCFDGIKLQNIPENHIYQQLIKKHKNGLVIGHMGDIQNHQENTLEGMKSLITIKADGMHMQVQLTKDNQLILFGDDNLYRMTGEDFEVAQLPYSEIAKMNIQSNIVYGKGDNDKVIKRTYNSILKIPLLEDVLNAVKESNMLVYIEMMPGNVPPTGPFDRHRSFLTAQYMAALIKSMKLENKVIAVSKDAFKLKALHEFNENIVFGWLINEDIFVGDKPNKIKYEYNDMPEIYTNNCFDTAPDNFTFAKYLLTSGIISKAMNASLIDLSIEVINNKTYYSKTETLKNVLKKNYGSQVTIGAFSVFSLKSSKQSKKEDIKFLEDATSKGVTRFITDDVNRAKLAFHETVIAPSTASILSNYFSILLLSIMIGKAIVTLIFV